MTLDAVAPIVEIAPTAVPTTDPSTATWEDISSRVLSVEIRQGRTAEHAACPSGTASITCVDPEGDLDPTNSGGAFAPLTLGALVRVSAAPTTYSAEVLADSPAGYWRLHETSGTSAADSSGGARTLTYTGSPTLGVPGPLTSEASAGVGLSAGPYASRAYTAALSPAAVTLEAWIWRDPAGTGERVISQCLASSLGYRLVLDASHRLKLYCNASSFYATSALPASTWTHVAATATNGAQVLYVNGVQVATGALSYSASGTATYYMGTNAGADLWYGKLAEVAVYGAALSAARVAAHYAAASAVPLFVGSVDDFAQDYANGGTGYAEVTLGAVDLFGAMALTPYAASITDVIARLQPYRWCRFGDLVGGSWEDVGAKRQRVRTVLSVRGVESGGPDGHGSAECDPGGGVGGYVYPEGLFGDMGSGDFTLVVAARPGWGVDTSTQNLAHIALPNWRLLWAMDGTSKRQLLVELNLQTNVHGIALGSSGGGWRHLAIATRPLFNAWHLFCFRRVTAGGNETFDVWMDGVQLGEVVTAGAAIAIENTRAALGGMAGATVELAHLALWQEGLADADITEMWAAMSGGAGELPGSRIDRALRAVGAGSWASVDAGQSLLGEARESSSAADVAQDAAQADEGFFRVAGDGTPTFDGRGSRRRRTATAVLGDGTGEVPYERIDPRYDAKDLYTVAEVNGQHAEDSAAVAAHGRRVHPAAGSRNVLLPRDAEARAYGIVAASSTPRLRVTSARVRIPGPGTPAALAWEPGTLLTVRRRPRSGQTIEQDSFVEGRTIALNATGEGTVTLTLSAAPEDDETAGAYGTATFGGSALWAS